MATKTLSALSYANKYLMGAPDIDKYDVEKNLVLSEKVCLAILNNPNKIADAIMDNYFDEKNPLKNAFYFTDTARRKLITKKDGQWVVDHDGRYIRAYLIEPIMMVSYVFNENRFKKEINKVGSMGRLSNTQLHVYDKYITNCHSIYKRKTQDEVIKGLLTCRLSTSTD
jgi:hypothetical protein